MVAGRFGIVQGEVGEILKLLPSLDLSESETQMAL